MGMLKLQLGRESEVHDSSMVSNVSCLLISNISVYLSLGVSIAIKTHNQKQLEEKRMYFILQVSSHNPSLREVKAGLKSGTEAELTGHCQLACSSYSTHDHQPKGGTAHNELGSPISIIKQDLSSNH